MKISLVLYLILFSLVWSGNSGAAGLRVVIIDVGMGQSVLLEEDGHGLLIDTGLAAQAPHVLARLKAYGVQKLDYLVLSHLHPDHAGGLYQIRQHWPDTPVLDNCHIPGEHQARERGTFAALQAVLARDPLHSCLVAGDTLRWQGHRVEVLWPGVFAGSNLNGASLVLLLATEQGGTLLLMGDVDKSVERALTATLESSLQGGGLDLYVAAHHAAADSTDVGFLRMLQPRFSIVSVGQENPYNYPAPASMDVLKKYSEMVLRTDKDGELCFVLGAEQVSRCRVLPDGS